MEVEGKKSEDLTGQASFRRNVLFSWGGHLVYVIAGFILPRLISDRLGQAALGVWDFAWTTIAYFGLIELGIGASVDRYVAKYRAAGDHEGLNRSVSSLFVCMLVLGLLIFGASILVAGGVIPIFANQLGNFTVDAGRIVILLGTGLAVEVALGVYWGVLVGVHRWDLHNSVSAAVYAISTVTMVVLLSLGYGLVSLAVVHCSGSILGHSSRVILAYRACPELRVRWQLARWSVLKEQTRFSAKNLIPRFAELIANQSVSIMLTVTLGPAALAVFSRPRALIKHVRTIVGKVSSILIPSASALHARGELDELRQMMLRRTEQVSGLMIPAMLCLSLLGGPFIELWMGKSYVHPWLLPALCLGAMATLMQDPLWAIMSGINQHGRLALVKLGAAVVASLVVALIIWPLGGSLVAVALGLAIPLAISDGIIIPKIACARLAVPLAQYYFVGLLRPLLLSIPTVIVIALARVTLAEPAGILLLGGGLGVVALFITYLRCGLIRVRSLRKARSAAAGVDAVTSKVEA